MTRTDAREFMMQVFFQMEACSDFDIDHRDSYFKDKKISGQKEYCENLYSLLCNHREDIDKTLENADEGWKLSRMPKTDLAVMRLAVCEILYLSDIPAAVSINEAVNIAKKYGTEDSPKYVNAILGKIVSERQ